MAKAKQLWIPVILFLATLALYAPVRNFAFVNYDDPDYTTANLHVRGGLTADGIAWAFRSTEAANWFPLTWMSHMLDVQLFGLDSGWHHLTNAMLHALTTALLFLLLFRTTGAPGRSAFVAAVFAAHPLHVESVAWVAERKDVLSALFWVLTLLAYVRFVERRTAGRYAVVLVAFACGLMLKPMIVTLPLTALLIDFWPLRRALTRAVFVEKAPLFALAAAVSVIVFLAQRGGGAVLSIDQLPLLERVSNAVVSCAVYALKLFWPSRLAVFYPFPAAVSTWQAIAAGLLLAGVSAFAIHARERRPFWFVGWFWYLVTLMPVIGIVQVGLQARADRYTYIPLIGLAIVLGWGVAEWISPRIAMGAAVVACLCWAVAARSYIAAWRDSETLFEYALASTSGNYVAYNNLGVALRDKGDSSGAIRNFEAAIAIRPGAADAQSNLGESLLRLGRLDDATPHVEEALRLRPSSPEAHVNLAAILSKRGKTEDAAAQYRAALQLDPANAEAHAGLGAILTDLDRPAEALRDLTEAVRLKPDDADAHYNLGRLFGLTGRTADAIGEFTQAIRLRPNDPQARYNLGVALAVTEQFDRAADEFRAAIRLDPLYTNAHFNLGNVLAQTGRCAEAIVEYDATLRLQPDFVPARRNREACR